LFYGETTVIVTGVLDIAPEVAVMFEPPTATPAARPVVFIETLLGSELAQVTEFVMMAVVLLE